MWSLSEQATSSGPRLEQDICGGYREMGDLVPSLKDHEIRVSEHLNDMTIQLAYNYELNFVFFKRSNGSCAKADVVKGDLLRRWHLTLDLGNK